MKIWEVYVAKTKRNSGKFSRVIDEAFENEIVIRRNT
jgi:hypothetical protein